MGGYFISKLLPDNFPIDSATRMKFNAEQYLDCSSERIKDAKCLHEDGQYVGAIYFAGVAVECLLRAYIRRKDPTLDERHDLKDMLKKSDLDGFITGADRKLTAAWLMDVWTRWKNNYRYASPERLKSEYVKLNLHSGIKGDFMKENCRIAVDSALELITKGNRKWTSNTK